MIFVVMQLIVLKKKLNVPVTLTTMLLKLIVLVEFRKANPGAERSESNTVEISQPDGILTCHALMPNYAVGSKAVTSKEISANQRDDPEL